MRTRAKATSYTRHATGILERAKCQDDASLSGDAFTSMPLRLRGDLSEEEAEDRRRRRRRAGQAQVKRCLRPRRQAPGERRGAGRRRGRRSGRRHGRARDAARFEDLSSDVVAKAQSLVAAVSIGSSPLLIFAGAAARRALRAAVVEAVPGAAVAAIWRGRGARLRRRRAPGGFIGLRRGPRDRRAGRAPRQGPRQGLRVAAAPTFCLKQTALPCLEADVSVAASRLAAFPGDKPSAEAALAPLAARRSTAARRAATAGSGSLVAVAGAGPALAVAVFAGGALVAAVGASGPRRSVLAAAAIAADAALSVAVEADGTRLPEVRVRLHRSQTGGRHRATGSGAAPTPPRTRSTVPARGYAHTPNESKKSRPGPPRVSWPSAPTPCCRAHREPTAPPRGPRGRRHGRRRRPRGLRRRGRRRRRRAAARAARARGREGPRAATLRGIDAPSGSEPSDWIVWRRLFPLPKPPLLRRLVARGAAVRTHRLQRRRRAPPQKPSYDEPRARPTGPNPPSARPGSGSATVRSLTLSESTDPHLLNRPRPPPRPRPSSSRGPGHSLLPRAASPRTAACRRLGRARLDII